jgi:sensor histidine kinase YesM
MVARDRFMSFTRNRIVKHALFWTAIFFFDVLVFGFDTQNYRLFFKIVALEMPGQMFLAYSMMYWTLPRFMERRYVLATSGFVLVFVVCAFVVHALFKLVDYYPSSVPLLDPSKLLIRGFYLFANAAIAVIIKLALTWHQNQQRIAELRKTQLESELKMLKDQVNPHFLFNTLNNLYGLIERNPTRAQETVLDLSRILHYMLHMSNQPSVLLKEELDCVRDYIALENLRYSGGLSISVNQEPATNNLSIVPLVIFPFVENSFKHGTSESLGEAWVNIDFSIHQDTFIFKIENGKYHEAEYKARLKSGIGLANVTRRLELVYGDDHTLQILDGAESFLVILRIKLERLSPSLNNRKEKNEIALSYR